MGLLGFALRKNWNTKMPLRCCTARSRYSRDEHKFGDFRFYGQNFGHLVKPDERLIPALFLRVEKSQASSLLFDIANPSCVFF